MLYKDLMKEFPNAREEESAFALRYLNLRKGEKILEVGAGTGFFTIPISEIIEDGLLIATDPSSEQLESIIQYNKKNIRVILAGSDCLPFDQKEFEENSFDAIWSGASFHHVEDKTQAFLDFYRLLKKGGRLVIMDVFSGTALAKHFDQEVAKYCISGHEVSFLNEDFADTLCFLAGFQPPKIIHETIRWKFDSMKDLGIFIYKIHGMTKTTPEKCAKRAEEILGVEYKDGQYYLNWPLSILITYKD
jgi:arsenite methyltransferase